MNRRTYLNALSLAGVTGVGGCFGWGEGGGTGTSTRTPSGTTPGTPTGTRTEPRGTETGDLTERFGTIVDMVEGRGVDPTGNEPIDEALQAAAGDDTLLRFPPGTYLVTQMLVLSNVRNFGIVGTGASRRDVQFVHPKRFADRFLNVRSGRDVLVRNFTVNQTADEVTNSGVVVLNDDGIIVEDFEVAGFTPSGDQGSVNLIVQVTSSSGAGTVRRFTSTGGGKVGVYPASYPGFFSGPQHAGTLRLIDFHLERCGSNGLYASRTEGTVEVMGGLFKNNDVAQVRLCGEGSFIRGARIVVDTDDVEKARGTYEGVRGIWWESGQQEKTGGYVENCDLVCRTANGRRALLQVDGTAGAMTVRDSRFRVDADNYFAIFTRPPGTSNMGGKPSKPWGIAVDNVRIRGSSAEGTAVRMKGRPGSTFVDTEVLQRGAGQDGIQLSKSGGTRLVRSNVVADRYPVMVNLPGTGGGESCIVRLEDVGELRSVALNPPDGDLVELSDSAGSRDEGYCIDADSVPFDEGRVAIAGLAEDDTVYLVSVEEVAG